MTTNYDLEDYHFRPRIDPMVLTALACGLLAAIVFSTLACGAERGGWFYTYPCVSASCARGVPVVAADRYYATQAQCMKAAHRDWYVRYSRGRVAECHRVD